MSAPISSFLLQHRHGHKRPHTPKFNGSNHPFIKPIGVARLSSQVGDMNNRPRLDHTTDRILSIGPKRSALAELSEGRRYVIRGHEV